MDYATTHREIVEACKAGERSAQNNLYKSYSGAMYNTCLRMLRNELDAEDVLQTSFMDVFSKLHTFRYDASIGSWIKRIVVNNCINFLKKKRIQLEELKEAHNPVQEEKEDLDPQYSVARIKQAINELPNGYRVVFSLYLLEGYDHKEIGEIMGITEATSKSQFSRAKQKLKGILIRDAGLKI